MGSNNEQTREGEQQVMRVLMFPWLAHGHISPFLELARRMARRNIYIYFCSTPVNMPSIQKQLLVTSNKLDADKASNSIELVEIHLPQLPNLPPHYHTTKSLPLHLMSTLKTALDLYEPTFFQLLKSIRPDIVIYDFIQPWAPLVASSLNIPAVAMLITGGATSSYFYHICINGITKEFPFSAIKLPDHEINKTSRLLSSLANGLTDKDRVVQSVDRSSTIVLAKTYREIEAKYIDYYHLLTGKELIGVGPLIQEPTKEDSRSTFVEWLDNKDTPAVFVSFGTEYYLSKEEMEELAYGLELSGVNFIWVLRFPEEENITSVDEAPLPKGFLERVGEKGMVVVNSWAPQSKILAHQNTGAFVSHCGSGSVTEALRFGVPIIGIPMHLDQPMNSKMVVELGVAAEVKRDEKSGRYEREDVEKVIKKVVFDKDGEQVRKKARELGEKLRKKGEEDIDVVVKKLKQVCGKLDCSDMDGKEEKVNGK